MCFIHFILDKGESDTFVIIFVAIFVTNFVDIISPFSGGTGTSTGDAGSDNISSHHGTDSGKMAGVSLTSRR